MSGRVSKKYEIDMCNGPLLGKMLIFYFPLMASSVLQLLFNTADVIVVGNFAGKDALAAVGSTSALINLLTNLFMGLSVGTNVLVARFFGAKQDDELEDMVHTSILTSLISGGLLLIVGVSLASPLLTLMGTTKDALPLAVLYLRIYFLGMPLMMLYNFGAAILRAVGDTKRPMIYLTIAGAINVALNLLFVIVFEMSVAGVALATIISQAFSAFMILRCLVMADGPYRIILKELHINPEKLKKLMAIGLPAGLQGVVFSFSNVLIQSSVNSFDTIAVAGNTAGANLEGYPYMIMNAWYQTAISFTGQNYGARKTKRILKVVGISLTSVTIVGLLSGNFMVLFSDKLLWLYNHDPEVISFGITRVKYICTAYFLCGIMDVMVGVIRGMGYSIMPTIVSLTGACLFRIIWICTVFKSIHTLEILYISYPISWLITFSVHVICFIFAFKKLCKTIEESST